jgi:hypothetical protein
MSSFHFYLEQRNAETSAAEIVCVGSQRRTAGHKHAQAAAQDCSELPKNQPVIKGNEDVIK